MAKKTFKDLKNPAMSFISMPDDNAPNTQYTDNTDDADSTDNTDNTYNTDNTHNTYDTHNTGRAANGKGRSNHPQPQGGSREAKSKRLNLLLWPSLHADLEKIAFVHRCSVNDLINKAMREYTEAHQADIEKHDQFVNE